ncbi:MAG: YrdB family protein [Nocardioidaceae bacterium]
MTVPSTPPESVGPVDVLAFGCELAMVVLLAVAGWAVGEGVAVSVLLAVVLPVVAIAVWGVWMAPRSSRRLANPARLAAQGLLFVATAALVALAGHPWWGAGFAVVAIAAFAARREPRLSRP